MRPLVSIIIRTLNEERHLNELLEAIASQAHPEIDVEVVIVDSGSTDSTLAIAKQFGCRITHIDKREFTFGRSLNMGCEFARGDILAFISGHCIPCSPNWLTGLLAPLDEGCDYVYGRQVGRDTTKFSEKQIFQKYFPEESRVPQVGFFCNNANAAIRRDVWRSNRFNEDLTGCEDMYLARSIVEKGGSIGYCADAAVFHIHDESWRSLLYRYEREAVALRKILPEVHINLLDFVRFVSVGIVKDFRAAFGYRVFWKEAVSICLFRTIQYYGAYKGNHIHRKISQATKMKYFYPRISDMDVSHRHRDLVEQEDAKNDG
jgi:rhamnosyltransferase